MSTETQFIEELIVKLSTDPHNPVLNFQAAVEYDRLNQTASAVSFYLRCVEFGHRTHHDYVYASLLSMAKCFEHQHDRQWTVSNSLLQAVAYMPQRPEAWFLLSRFHERSNNWQESYTMAEAGLAFSHLNHPPLPTWVEYPGEYGLRFQKYVAAWWVGRRDESIAGLKDLLDKYPMHQEFVNACINNLKRIG